MLMRAESRDAIVARTLGEGGWWTVAELAALVGCNRQIGLHLLRLASQQQLVFRRRRTAKWKPFEYRTLARAVNVQVKA